MNRKKSNAAIDFEVIPSGAALGAEIVGVDLRDVDKEALERLRKTWVEHEVLFFRDQNLTASDLIRFSRYPGELEHAPIQESGPRRTVKCRFTE